VKLLNGCFVKENVLIPAQKASTLPSLDVSCFHNTTRKNNNNEHANMSEIDYVRSGLGDENRVERGSEKREKTRRLIYVNAILNDAMAIYYLNLQRHNNCFCAASIAEQKPIIVLLIMLINTIEG
jgi:hypothetical protein